MTHLITDVTFHHFCCIFFLGSKSLGAAHTQGSGWGWGYTGYRGSLRACMLSCFNHVQLFVTPGIVAHQAPLSMGFSRQIYWSGLPCPPPGNLPDPESNLRLPRLLHWQVDSLPTELPGKPEDHWDNLKKLPIAWRGQPLE